MIDIYADICTFIIHHVFIEQLSKGFDVIMAHLKRQRSLRNINIYSSPEKRLHKQYKPFKNKNILKEDFINYTLF